MPYQVKIPVFEGPMDLLLHLIEKNEMDIYNIPIALITEQYLQYLALADEVDLELTSEFVLMACTLLSIKARMLLPRQVAEQSAEGEEGMDPRDELVAKLLEYKEFKEKAVLLKEKELEQSRLFWRETDEAGLLRQFPPANPVGDLGLQDLLAAYNVILRKIEKKNEFFAIAKDEITIQEKIEVIMAKLMQNPDGFSFSDLFSDAESREEVIVTFLALLELVRQGVIILRQSYLFSDIRIYQREGGSTLAHAVS